MIPRQPCSSARSVRRIILLVEDDPVVRDVTCLTLQHAGYQVLGAASAAEALAAFSQRDGRIDLMMTDFWLPDGNGRQLSRDVRKLAPLVPVLLTSGYLDADWDCAQREPGTFFIAKPYNRQELTEAMAAIFGDQPAQSASRAG